MTSLSSTFNLLPVVFFLPSIALTAGLSVAFPTSRDGIYLQNIIYVTPSQPSAHTQLFIRVLSLEAGFLVSPAAAGSAACGSLFLKPVLHYGITSPITAAIKLPFST